MSDNFGAKPGQEQTEIIRELQGQINMLEAYFAAYKRESEHNFITLTGELAKKIDSLRVNVLSLSSRLESLELRLESEGWGGK